MQNSKKRGFDSVKNNFFLEGGFSFANFTLLNGIFLVGFALSLGANNIEIGILTSIPLFANLLQMVSAYILELTGTRKWTSILSLFIGRSLWVIVILMGLGYITFDNPIFLFMLVSLVSNLFSAAGNLSLLSWIKSLVPRRRIARFFGKRNIFASSAGILVYIIGSYVIDYFNSPKIFSYIFLVALILGIVGLFFLFPVYERKSKIKAISPKKYIYRMSQPFKDAYFKRLLSFGLLWGFALNLASPYFLVFMLKDLKLSFLLVSVFLVLETLGRIYGLSLWGSIADRFGAKPVLIFSSTITAAFPLAFFFVGEHNFYLIPVFFVISAFSYAGVDISINQVLFKSAKRKYDAYYLSAYTSLIGLTSALGPIIGGILAEFIRNSSHAYFDFFPALKYVFLISFVLRVSCLPLIARIHEPKAGEVKDVINRMKTLKFASFFVSFYSISHYASKIVLIPQKQFFMIQRNTVWKLKRDLSSTMDVISKIADSAGNITSKNINYYKMRFKILDNLLNKNIEKLDYIKGSVFRNIPLRVHKRIEKLESEIEAGKIAAVKREAKALSRFVESYEEKLEKAYDKEIAPEYKNQNLENNDNNKEL